MMSRQAWLISISAISAAILLIVYSLPIAEFFVGLFFEKPVDPIVIAEVEDRKGSLSIRRSGESIFVSAQPPIFIYHWDQLKLEKGGSATIKFLSGWRIVLNENTLAVFELYRPKSPDSPALLTLSRGHYSLIENGAPGQLFISQDKKLFIPQTKPVANMRAIRISPSHTAMQPVEPLAAEAEALTSGTQAPLTPGTQADVKPPPPKTLASALKPGKLPDKLPAGDEETLSSAYIEQVLSSQATPLRNCQQNTLRDDKPAEGSMLLSLTISPTGRIEQVKILQDQIQNSQLSNCVVSVIERARFKAFTGLPISLTYPLEFK